VTWIEPAHFCGLHEHIDQSKGSVSLGISSRGLLGYDTVQ
jgi:hypothetical protein